MPVHPEQRDEIIARINKKYEGGILRGNEFEHADRIPTGSVELDLAMDGGLPQGRWTRFYGSYHSTKTMRALIIIGIAQKMGQTCAYYNIEKQFDPVFAEHLGVNVEELTVANGASIEEIGDKAESLFGVCHLHVFDSCTIAVSEDELNADIRDWRPGISARAWGKVFKRLNERFDEVENTVILIDQMRTNFKTGGEQAAGGQIFDFQSSMSVLFKRHAWLYRNADGFLDEKAKQAKSGMTEMVEPAGYAVKCRIEKSRVCRPFRTAEMRLDLDTMQFDDIYELSKAAKHYGVVQETSVGRFEYEGQKFHGEPKLRAFLRGDVTAQEDIRAKALAYSRR